MLYSIHIQTYICFCSIMPVSLRRWKEAKVMIISLVMLCSINWLSLEFDFSSYILTCRKEPGSS